MKLMRGQLAGVWRAQELAGTPYSEVVTIAGVVICRQRPGTAKGFVFIWLEDETGVTNAVVAPDLFEKERLTITQEGFLQITGPVQTRQGLLMVRADRIERLASSIPEGTTSYDFH